MKGLSLFANIGIAETYLSDLGFDVVVANELIQKRADIYSYFYPETTVISGDITLSETKGEIISASKKANIEFIMATPPCQGMSVAGKNKADDQRNFLIYEIAPIFNALKPKFLFIENVPKLLKLKSGDERVLDKFYDMLDLSNYEIIELSLNAKDYGTPQNRQRSIILILNKKLKFELPGPQDIITVEDAIGHLPSLEAGEKSSIKYHEAKEHKKEHILWLRHTPTGKTAHENKKYYPQKPNGERIKGYSTTYKRISWDKPAPTITMANGSVSSQNNVHPGKAKGRGIYSDARVLTLKEIILLTGLPEDWIYPEKLCGQETIRKLIGEGIPPHLVEQIFKGIKNV